MSCRKYRCRWMTTRDIPQLTHIDPNLNADWLHHYLEHPFQTGLVIESCQGQHGYALYRIFPPYEVYITHVAAQSNHPDAKKLLLKEVLRKTEKLQNVQAAAIVYTKDVPTNDLLRSFGFKASKIMGRKRNKLLLRRIPKTLGKKSS